MTTVQNGHVRGLTPDMSVTDKVCRKAVPRNRETTSQRVQNGHGWGLAPAMAESVGA